MTNLTTKLIEVLVQEAGKETVLKAVEACKDSKGGKSSKADKGAKDTKGKDAEEDSNESEDDDKYADIRALTYNQAKSKCKSMGLDMTGGKADLVERIINSLEEEGGSEDDSTDGEGEEDDINSAEELKNTLEEYEEADIKGLAEELGIDKKGKKSAVIARIVKAYEAGEITEEDIFGDEEGSEEPDLDSIKEVLESSDIKAVKAVAKLVGVKLSIKDKKVADVVAKIADALEAGDVEVDDLVDACEKNDIDLGVSSEEGGDEEGITLEDIMDDLYITEDMTDERAEIIKEIIDEVVNEVESEELSEEDINGLLEEFYVQKDKGLKIDEPKELKEAKDLTSKVVLLIRARARMVDDAGEEHEFGEAYTITLEGEETVMCCGHVAVETKEGFQCIICETEHE